MLEFIKKSFHNLSGKPSGRRITVALSLLMVIQAFIGDQYFKFAVNKELFSYFFWIVITGMGLTTDVSGSVKDIAGIFGKKPEETK